MSTGVYDVFYEFATDEKKEVDGIDITLAPGVGFRVARVGNDRYTARMVEEMDKHAEELAKKTPASVELDKELTLQVRAETILMDFWGMSYQGEPCPYSVENAKKLLRVKDFRTRVLTEATKFENYRVAQEAQRGED
jgi:hypothetical protein